MIIQNEKREVFTSSNGEEINFSINVNDPNIFNILRSSLYGNPIKSVVREIISNAIDAHSNLSIETPIEITCPGEYFVVKDFGGGISPERMKGVFSVYGASTKREDNSQIGGFGLGAKSPFSICDQYIIITHYDGMRYTYQAYIDATGIGKIKIISETSSDDKGTTVKIPVKSSQTYQFKDVILFYARHLRVYPKIRGGTYGFYSEPTERVVRILEGEKWCIFKSDPHCNILVDQIPYSLDVSSCCGSMPKNFVFLFETGEVDIAAPRESIRVTPKTIEKIKAVYEDYQVKIGQIVQDKINILDNIEEVFNAINDFVFIKNNKWNWRDLEFDYPFLYADTFKKQDNQTVLQCYLYGSKGKLEKNRSDKIYPTGNNCIYTTKTPDELTAYDNRRLKSHIVREKLHSAFIVDDQFLNRFPTLKIINLTDIKCQPGEKRGAPKYIRGKKPYVHQHNLIPFDYDKDVIYCLEFPNYQYLNRLPVEIYKIATKHQKFVEDKENWYTLDEYIEEKITDKYKPDEIQSLYRNWYYNQTFNEFIKFSDIIKEKDFKPLLTQEYDGILLDFMKKNELFKTDKLFDLFDKYPMLKLADIYRLRNNDSIVRNYILQINGEDK